ncbi:type VII secretion protein EccCa [Mycobacterium sp. DSM 3803]|nr:type VII secretion protein EccCa [Mycobacterium sp. DSM 3803]
MKQAFGRKEPLEPPTKVQMFVLQLIAPLKVRVPAGKPWWLIAIGVVVIGLLVAMLWLSFASGARTFNGIGGLFPILMVFGVLAMLFGGRFGGSNQMSRSEMDSLRAQFMARQDEQRKETGRVADELDANYRWYHPPTDTLEAAVGGPRTWERRPEGDDSWFGVVRVGRGMTSLIDAGALTLADPVDDMPTDIEMEPATGVALQEFIRCQQSAYGTPALISLLAEPGWRLDGDRDDVLALMRAVLAQMTFSHGPDHLKVMVVTADIDSWEAVKWLPHVADSQREDAAGPLRMVYASVRELRDTGVLDNKPGFEARHGGHRGMVSPLPHTVIISDVDAGWSGVPGMSQDGSSDGAPNGISGFTVFDLRGTVPLCGKPERLLRLRPGGVIDAVPRNANTFHPNVEPKAVFFAKADMLGADDFENFAQAMARWRLAQSYETIDLGEEFGTRARDVLGFYEIDDPAAIDFDALYRPRRNILSPDRLKVPVGTRVDTGELVILNTTDMADSGDGPHGWMVGMTGSGKTEALKVFLLSLMCGHPPENLRLVLADFKGGSGVLPFVGAAHTSCVITDLEEDQDLLGRFVDGLFGEIARRKQMCKDADVPDAKEYNKKRIDLARDPDGPQLEPMPILQVVLDEFEQAFNMTDDIWKALHEIARQGRTLWIHMLLASQEITPRAEKLMGNCGYGIALKAGSSTSAATSGVPAALRLPKIPGLAYLKLGAEDLTKIKFDYLWREYRKPGTEDEDNGEDTSEAAVDQFDPQFFSVMPNWNGLTGVGAGDDDGASELGDGEPAQINGAGKKEGEAAPPAKVEMMRKPAVGDVMLEQFRALRSQDYRLFCPPLDRPRTIDDVVEMYLRRPWGEEFRYPIEPSLRFPVGIIDRPFKQDQQPLVVDGRKNLLVLGTAGSGKTTVLQDLICAAAMTHSPEQVQFYVLAMSSAVLRSVRELPHVGLVATNIEEDAIRRIVSEMVALLERRRRSFGEWDVQSMDDFRARKAALVGKTREEAANDPVSTDPYGDVYLVVDNLFALTDQSSTMRDRERIVDYINRLINDGGSFGIHVVVAVSRLGQLMPGSRNMFSDNRIELKVETADALLVSGSQAAKVPSKPGRGMVKQNYMREGWSGVGLHTMMARPALRGTEGHAFESQSVVAMVAKLATGYQPARPVHLLPARVDLAQLQESAARHQHSGMVWAMNEFALPVGLENSRSPFLAIVGEPDCGRTTTCAAIMTEIARFYAPGASKAEPDSNDARRRAQVWLYSPGRELLRVLGREYLERFAYRADVLRAMIKDLAAVLAERQPAAGKDVDEALQRSWEGPEIFLVIDDGHRLPSYDSVFNPLLEAANAAQDVGLHIIYTRQFGGWVHGAGRDPLVATMNQANMDLLVMDSSPDDGYVANKWKGHPMPPGRGFLMGTDGPGTYVQVGWVPVDSENG